MSITKVNFPPFIAGMMSRSSISFGR